MVIPAAHADAAEHSPQIEEAFVEEIEEDRERARAAAPRRAALATRAASVSAARGGSMRFASARRLIATAVLVTIVMFETLYVMR